MVALRLFLLMSLVLASACSSPGSVRLDAGEWRQLQRQRLRTLYAMDESPRANVPDGVAAAARTGTVPQEPERRHIDQIEPPLRRPVQSPSGLSYVARVGIGGGRLSIDAANTRFHGDDTAAMAFAVVEPRSDARVGPGLKFEALTTGNDLFSGELMNDGQSVRPAEARAIGFDSFPHLVFRPHVADRIDLPVRVGGFVDNLRVHHRDADVRRNWLGFGARIEAEPSWRFYDEGGVHIDLCTLLGADIGAARFTEQFLGSSDHDTVRRLMGEVGVGVRVSTRTFIGEIGYRYRGIDYATSETSLFGTTRTSVDSDMLYLDAGLRF